MWHYQFHYQPNYRLTAASTGQDQISSPSTDICGACACHAGHLHCMTLSSHTSQMLLQLPDYVVVCVCPLAGLSRVSHEHLAVALALEVPVACVITKADIAPPEAVRQVLGDIRCCIHSHPHMNLLCHVMSCHVMSCHVMSCHVMSCHVMSCHVMSSFPCTCTWQTRRHISLVLYRGSSLH